MNFLASMLELCRSTKCSEQRWLCSETGWSNWQNSLTGLWFAPVNHRFHVFQLITEIQRQLGQRKSRKRQIHVSWSRQNRKNCIHLFQFFFFAGSLNMSSFAANLALSVLVPVFRTVVSPQTTSFTWRLFSPFSSFLSRSLRFDSSFPFSLLFFSPLLVFFVAPTFDFHCSFSLANVTDFLTWVLFCGVFVLSGQKFTSHI